MIKFQVEKFAAVCEEAQPLLERHWEEIANYRDFIPLSPNYARYALLDSAGKFLVVTARNDGALIAYAAFRVDLSDHYCTTLWSESDLIWVMPEHRRAHVGIGIVSLAEKEMLARGVVVSQIRSKVNHPQLGQLLAAMGYEPVEMVHAKVLQKPE